MVKLYISKTHDKLNKKLVDIENISEFLCLNPNYKHITLTNTNVKVLMDSGAYQDQSYKKRLTFEETLLRQLSFEQKLGIVSEKIVAYDLIGNKNETVAANKFLSKNRNNLKPRQLVLMIQGQDYEECIECIVHTLKFAEKNDCIGFGGVATAGKNKTVQNKLLKTLKYGLPLIIECGIKDIHVFGVGTIKIMEKVINIVNEYNYKINVSCDTSAFEVRSVFGSVLNYDTQKWEKIYTKKQKFIDYHPCDLFKQNVKIGIKIFEAIT